MQPSASPSWHSRLRQERIRRNWRQQDLADQLGTSVVTIKRWERGSQQPSAYFRIKLCAIFGKSVEEFGLVEQASPLPTTNEEAHKEIVPTYASSPPEELTVWTVPSLRNPHFTGRDGLLERLTQHLSPAEANESTATHCAALTQTQAIKGLGGIGKTQIAVEYAYRAREQGRYSHTIWINAASEETIIASFMTLAEQLSNVVATHKMDQRKLIAAIIRWLEQCQERWLLIFDNADDLTQAQQYVPHQGNGSILLTTRAHAVGSVAVALEVETMGLVEGTQFLLRRAQRADASDEECNEATNVVIALDGFPLALDQAGAYIEETGCCFEEYLQLYQQHRQTLLARRGKQVTTYPDSVATTWSLSFQKVEQANPAAAEFLRLCAFLAPDHIPEELLKEGATYWPPALQHAAADPFAFNQMLGELLAFSLVKRLTESRLLSLHRLVQAVQMDAIEPEEQHQWAERIVCAVNSIFPRNLKEEVATWPQCLRYLEQAQRCDTLIQQYRLQLPEAADVLLRTGLYLAEHASHTLAEPLYQHALHIREQQLGPEHPDVASILNNLALLYRQQGRYAEAEPLFLRTLHIWEQQLGPEHPDVATALNNLATFYGQQGKYTEAEPLFLRTLAIWEQHLGPDHLKMAYPLNNLALFYGQQGRYAEAEPLFLRALAIREQRLGPDHPQMASPLNNLATLYGQQNRYAEAEPLFLRALTLWEQHLGPDHPLVSHPLQGLANVYSKQGQYVEAESLFLRALRIREQQLGPEHPDTAETLHDVATLRERQGYLQEACALYQRALAIREQTLGSAHPETMETRTCFLTLLHAMGQHEKAALLEAVQ